MSDQIALIWKRIPKVKCKGLCDLSCGPIGMTAKEFKRLRKAAGHRPTTTKDGTCSVLDSTGRCSAYTSRPTVCRLYGVTENLRCPFGCKPDRMLSVEEGREIMRDINRIGGKVQLTIGGTPCG